MKQGVKTHELRKVGPIGPITDVQTMRFLGESEQFSARSCARCDGLLVNDWCYDLNNTGEHISSVLRCVQCGHRIDPVILQNQIHRRSNARVNSECR